MSLRFILSKAFSFPSKFPYWLSLRQELQFWHQNRCSLYIITKETFVSWFRILEISFLLSSFFFCFLGSVEIWHHINCVNSTECFLLLLKHQNPRRSSSLALLLAPEANVLVVLWGYDTFFIKAIYEKKIILYFFSSTCKSYWGWRQWTIEA